MTTATSTIKSFAKTHYKNKLNANKKLFFITTFLQILGLPIISLMLLLETKASEETYHAYSDYEFPMVLSSFAFIAALLMAIFIVTSNFKHLHNHAFSDMQLALPLNSKQRFFSNYLAGLTTYLVPALIAMPLAIIPCIIGKINYPEYYDLAFRYLPKFAVIIIIGMVMFYTFSVFSATYCGTLADTIINIFLINAVIPLSLYCASLSIGEGFTVSSMDMPILMSQIMYTSPIGCAIMLLFSSNTSLLVNSPIFAYWVILSCAVIALVIFLSYITYKKRKAEQVSSPYAFKIFYHIFMFFLVFCIFNLLNSFISSSVYYYEDYTIEERTHYANILPAFITSAVVFFVIEFISNRGIKKFLHSAVRYTCAIIFAIGFRGLAIATHGFGYDTYVPKAYMVDSVSITDYSELPEIYIDDKELIKKIVELNSDIVNSNNDEKPEPISEFEYSKLAKDAYVDNYNYYDSITINYIKKNGSIISRSYPTTSGIIDSILPYIMTSEDYADKIIKELKLAFKEYSHNYLYLNTDSMQYSIDLDEHMVDNFIQALETDISDISLENFHNSSIIGHIDTPFLSITIPIKDCFTNTLSILEKNSLDKNFLSKNPTNLEDCIVELYPNVISAETIYNGITDETKYIIHDNIEYFGEAFTLGSVSNIDIDKCADEIRELLEVSKPYSKKSEVGGVIAVDSKVYYVPIEYKDKVAEIYNKYKLDIKYHINEYGDFYLKYDDYGHETYIDILPGFFRNDIGVYKYNESGEKVYIFKYDEFQYYN
ncbi:MAG: hypothetical protein IJN05_10510 [Ruminococcus sp.]|nr:hypothetical protein [Ruminococcus sp.]